AVPILVRKFKLFSVDLDQLDFVGGTEADVRAFTRVDVTDNSLHECSQIPRRAMMDFKHNGGIAIVFDGHSSAEIVGGGHGEVEPLKRGSAEFTCTRRDRNCFAILSS